VRCAQVRRIIEEEWPEELSGALREHLAACPACDGWARQARWLVAGFRALAREETPELSWGFASRLTRRLEAMREPAAEAEEFLVRVGRRVVYGTCILTLVLLLALVLPASGPVRGPTSAELYLAQAETAVAGNDLTFLGEYLEGNSQSLASPAEEGTNSKP
jgi:hypothetical protein